MLRTAEGLGVNEVILAGYTPYPRSKNDPRLPYLAEKINKQITKTSLGAENNLNWRHADNIKPVIKELKAGNFTISALEQAAGSIELPKFKPPKNLALIVGREVEGIEPEVIELCDITIEIPMAGSKESFNVASAAAIALAYCKFYDKIITEK